jgi:hypothetical protein
LILQQRALVEYLAWPKQSNDEVLSNLNLKYFRFNFKPKPFVSSASRNKCVNELPDQSLVVFAETDLVLSRSHPADTIFFVIVCSRRFRYRLFQQTYAISGIDLYVQRRVLRDICPNKTTDAMAKTTIMTTGSFFRKLSEEMFANAIVRRPKILCGGFVACGESSIIKR